MKIFNQKHEAIIDVSFTPKKDNAKEGEVIPHGKRVDRVFLYHPHYIGDQVCYIKIEISKQMIFDLADQIQDIESEIIERPYDGDLPW
jgi:hypothetical protein